MITEDTPPPSASATPQQTLPQTAPLVSPRLVPLPAPLPRPSLRRRLSSLLLRSALMLGALFHPRTRASTVVVHTGTTRARSAQDDQHRPSSPSSPIIAIIAIIAHHRPSSPIIAHCTSLHACLCSCIITRSTLVYCMFAHACVSHFADVMLVLMPSQYMLARMFHGLVSLTPSGSRFRFRHSPHLPMCTLMRTFVFSSSLNHVAVCLCVLVLACIAPHHHIHPFTSQHCAGSCFAACAGCTISSGSSLHPRPPSFRHPFLLISGGGQCSIVVPPILTRYRLWVEIGFIESVSKCIHSSILSQA